MKWIKKFEAFDLSIEGDQTKDLTWIKSLIEQTMSTGEWDCSCNIETDREGLQFLNCKNGTYQLHIYDNLRDNDFFYVRIFKDGDMVQDFIRYENEKDGFSPDEIASEDIIVYFSRYFQKS